jgi:hypothetical protein
MAEVDIRHRTRQQTSICELSDKWTKITGRYETEPEISHVKDLVGTHERLIHTPDKPGSAPAKLPAEYFDQVSQRIWRNQEWETLFQDLWHYPYTRLEECKEAKSVNFEATLPDPAIKEILKTAWSRGVRKQKNSRRLSSGILCEKCGTLVSGSNGGSVKKMFKFHVKRKHKPELKRRDSYAHFADATTHPSGLFP